MLQVEESAPKVVADRLPALRESVSLTRHESRQNIRVGASLRSWQAYAGLCAMATSQSRRGALGKRLLGEGSVWVRSRTRPLRIMFRDRCHTV